MDNLFAERKANKFPNVYQRILRIYKITDKRIYYNICNNVFNGFYIFTFCYKNKNKNKKIKGGIKMSENNLVGIVTWIVGILVALAVGSGMINGTLAVPGIPTVITMIAGWVVVIGAILSVILAIFNK